VQGQGKRYPPSLHSNNYLYSYPISKPLFSYVNGFFWICANTRLPQSSFQK
jgi:hypothetical protein